MGYIHTHPPQSLLLVVDKQYVLFMNFSHLQLFCCFSLSLPELLSTPEAEERGESILCILLALARVQYGRVETTKSKSSVTFIWNWISRFWFILKQKGVPYFSIPCHR